MINPYTDTTETLRNLFIKSRKDYAASTLGEAIKMYGREEVERQVFSKSGPIVDKMNQMVDSWAKKTENVEFVTALGLSDFYFGLTTPTKISFEMKAGFAGGKFVSYTDLLANIDTATHIDCSITDGKQTLNFQIKRYPQAYHEHANEPFIKWLNKEVFLYYGDMKGMILVVILQPNTPPTQTMFDIPKLSAALLTDSTAITFDEVALTYTDIRKEGMFSVLHKIYPKNGRVSIPLESMLKRFRGEL